MHTHHLSVAEHSKSWEGERFVAEVDGDMGVRAWYKDSGERQGMPRPFLARLFPRSTSSLLRQQLGVIRFQDPARTDGVHACLCIPDMVEERAESAPFCRTTPGTAADKNIRSLIATCKPNGPITVRYNAVLTNTSPDMGRVRLGIAAHIARSESRH